MDISAKVEYACVAVLELAARFSCEEPVRVREIADAHGIPPRFLVQILLQLKGAGLVKSTRGAAGGYLLNKDPEQISIADVVGVMEGPARDAQSNAAVDTATTHLLLRVWNEAAKLQWESLEAVNFGTLVDRLRQPAEDMYHI